MTIALVSVREADYPPNRRLIEAARVRGDRAVLVHPHRCWPALFHGRPTLLGAEEAAAAEVIVPRQGAPIGDASLSLLEHLEAMGLPFVNGPRAVAVARDKFRTSQALAEAGLPVPGSVLCNNPDALDTAVERLGGLPLVAKPRRGSRGEGVELLRTTADVAAVAASTDPYAGWILQRFIPPERRRDLRVLVIGGKVTAAVELRPSNGSFLTNVHQGGVARQVVLEAGIRKLCLRATRVTGLEVAGIDLILDEEQGPLFLELNYAPGFSSLETVTGLDVAGQIIEYAAAKVRRSAGVTAHRNERVCM